MPLLDEWQGYLEQKQYNHDRLVERIHEATYKITATGRTLGVLLFPTDGERVIGGTGQLFNHGCDIALLYDPAFGPDRVRKFTIAARHLPVCDLLSHIDKYEPGWGGHRNIIGSPRSGSHIKVEIVIRLMVDNL
jgi:hypothetical protein